MTEQSGACLRPFGSMQIIDNILLPVVQEARATAAEAKMLEAQAEADDVRAELQALRDSSQVQRRMLIRRDSIDNAI
eukprot:scaffold193969_cov41-Prasinocladus_malaysianus.AAC.1